MSELWNARDGLRRLRCDFESVLCASNIKLGMSILIAFLSILVKTASNAVKTLLNTHAKRVMNDFSYHHSIVGRLFSLPILETS